MSSREQAHPKPRAAIGDVADHLEHIRTAAGVGHVGIGSDFDGIPEAPVGLEGLDKFPALPDEPSAFERHAVGTRRRAGCSALSRAHRRRRKLIVQLRKSGEGAPAPDACSPVLTRFISCRSGATYFS